MSREASIQRGSSHQEHLARPGRWHGALLVKIGWLRSRRVRATTAHLRIRDGKIWIAEDMTEEGLATELMAHGVAKEDIVLAFHSPEMRKHTEFAVA